MEKRHVRIGPSILTANWLNLGAEIERAEAAGVDFVHLDVMDGVFVPNISFGLPIVEAVRAATQLPLDVHLMIAQPERYVERFIDAGADLVSIHVEACTHLHGTLMAIAAAGAIPSVTFNPATPLSSIEEVIPLVGQVLVMSVNPGFGGQTFIPTALDRIRRLRLMIDTKNPACRLQVDGGIKESNIARVVSAGADTLVVGSAIYAPGIDVSRSVQKLRDAASQ